ncbi:hypothetical protein [Paenarthrobacter histidinolovorans]
MPVRIVPASVMGQPHTRLARQQQRQRTPNSLRGRRRSNTITFAELN